MCVLSLSSSSLLLPLLPGTHAHPTTALQVWKAPGLEKSVAPMELHRTYGQCHSDITAVDWSPDSQWLVAGGKDLSSRVFSLHPVDGYRPPTLAGHREPLVAGAWRVAGAVAGGDMDALDVGVKGSSIGRQAGKLHSQLNSPRLLLPCSAVQSTSRRPSCRSRRG